MAATASSAERGNGSSVAAFACGLAGLVLSLVLFWLLFPVALDVLAIGLGMRGRRAAAAGARQGGLATAGLVLGLIGLAVFAFWIVLIAFGVGEESGR